jgi:hypothetical protein
MDYKCSKLRYATVFNDTLILGNTKSKIVGLFTIGLCILVQIYTIYVSDIIVLTLIELKICFKIYSFQLHVTKFPDPLTRAVNRLIFFNALTVCVKKN